MELKQASNKELSRKL